MEKQLSHMTKRPTSYEGAEIWEVDTDKIWRFNGMEWVFVRNTTKEEHDAVNGKDFWIGTDLHKK